MAADSKFEDKPERASLTDTELDGVVAGSAMSDYANMMQTLAACMRMLADTSKALVGNIR
jgi:hypothetical protein